MKIEMETLLKSAIVIAQEAGKKILDIYHQPIEQKIDVKRDGSPLTLADKISNEYILSELAKLTPDIPILSEETTDIPFSERAKWERYWLIDPLDGTKEFINRTGEFTVNIALIDAHHPMIGVVFSPMSAELYYASRGHGAFKQLSEESLPQPIHVTAWKEGRIRIVASRRHGADELSVFLKRMGEHEITFSGSSLKFCRVAEGMADIYPRLGTTSEWDTAAAQCIVEQAGGVVMDLYGLPLQYNMRDSLQNPHFLAVGDKKNNWLHYFKSEDVLKSSS